MSLIDGTWSSNNDDFRIIFDEILMKNDEFFVLADFDSYLKAQDEIERRYLNRNSWARSCLVNIAKSGYFSSDRTIEEYAKDIWKLEKMSV
jgi:starch phosphorylase